MKKTMKVALTRKRIALILALLMLSAGSVSVYAVVLRNSNTIAARQDITAPTRPVIGWLQKPSNALTGEEFTMMVNITNPNSKVLAGWVLNITVTGSGLIDPSTEAPMVSLALVGGRGWPYGYSELYPYSASATQLVFLAPSFTAIELRPGENDWAFVGRSLTSGTLRWYVTLIPASPWQVPA